jgi:phage terminase large subunit GpA-like protein
MRCLDRVKGLAATGFTPLQTALIAAVSLLAPPPKLTVSQWADTFRYLSPEASAEPGKWSTDRAPYQREVMDEVSNPMVEDIVCMWSSQVGKSEVEYNAAGYFIDQDPSPILFVLPILDMAEATSKDRLTPMFRDSPCFHNKIKDARARDSGNTLLHKTFPGGHLTLAGANSPASLAGRPIRIFIGDEVDRWPRSAGAEGSPIRLGFKRTATFWNRKRLLVSSPTIKGDSAIEDAFDQSDQRHYYVSCPHCGEEQTLVWKDETGAHHVIWDKDPQTQRHKPETARYVCGAQGCGVLIDLDAHKAEMLRKGRWIKHNPSSKIAGFYLNELYSPWRKLQETVGDYLAAKREGMESFKSWFNTTLGLPWDPQDHQDVSADGFLGQRETYGSTVPWGVGLLTASVDVQHDRLELIVIGWGRANESWVIHHEKIYGSPAFADVWERMDARLLEGYRHASGRMLFIEACAVDTGDGNVKEAYEWAKARIPRRVIPIKGQGAPAHPLIKKSGNKKLKLWHIGTNAAKDTLSARLRLKEIGPGYMHFPNTSIPERYGVDWCDLDFFKQLTTSEHVVRDRKGRGRHWEKIRPDSRNEVLDLSVYAWAIFAWLNLKPAEMDKRLAHLEEPFEAPPEDLPEAHPRFLKPPPRRKRKVASKGLFEKP